MRERHRSIVTAFRDTVDRVVSTRALSNAHDTRETRGELGLEIGAVQRCYTEIGGHRRHRIVVDKPATGKQLRSCKTSGIRKAERQELFGIVVVKRLERTESFGLGAYDVGVLAVETSAGTRIIDIKLNRTNIGSRERDIEGDFKGVGRYR